MSWPRVLTEYETLDELARGRSLARFGDGELKCAYDEGYRSQDPNPKLGAELRAILTKPHERCLPAIPTMRPDVVNAPFWEKHRVRFAKLLNLKIVYGSAFIGRADMAPWIDCVEYVEKFRSIWAGKRVVLIAPLVNPKARRVFPDAPHVVCPDRNAYNKIDQLEEDAMKLQPDLVMITAGPTATALAHRLTVRGVQAIDGGRFSRIMIKRRP